MLTETHVIETFPSVRLPSHSGGLPVEVSLIAQLGHGAGNHLFASIVNRQQHHNSFVDELDEPSAKLGGTSFDKGDATSLYSFIVGPKGHPFHRHAGHRIFTAVSGSGGAQLRFSSATTEQIAHDPQNFIRALRYVNIPPDCMFTVRFGGETWHQFYPLSRGSLHPVFFALSCHTNELGGNLSDSLKQKVLANEASIPALTELLPPDVMALLHAKHFDAASIPTTVLALDAPAGTFHRIICNTVRSNMGIIRGRWGSFTKARGFLTHSNPLNSLSVQKSVSPASLLYHHLAELKLHHEDTFCLTVKDIDVKNHNAAELLAMTLEGFMLNAPGGVSRLMALRNLIVRPLGLRTSPLGCPVSSLLSDNTSNLFAGQYPVRNQSVSAQEAQVILGANDKHLMFRSCIGVKIINNHHVEFTMGNRVHCKNTFGRFYMGVIDIVHQRYIAPAMLRRAVDYAVAQAA